MLYSLTNTDIQRFLVTREKVVEDSLGDVSVPEAVQAICDFAHERTPSELRQELDNHLLENKFARHGVFGTINVYQMGLLDIEQVCGMLDFSFIKPPENDLEKRALLLMIDQFVGQLP